MWYTEQKEAWKAQTQNNSQDEAAWPNYYHAAHYMGWWGTNSDSLVREVMSEMKQAIPETYTYNFCAYRAVVSGHSDEKDGDRYAEAALKTADDYDTNERTLLQTIIDKYGSKVYFSTTTPLETMEPWKDKLYNEGLTLKYSKKPYDNLAVKRRNVEERYMLEYLLVSFRSEWTSGQRLSANYAVRKVIFFFIAFITGLAGGQSPCEIEE